MTVSGFCLGKTRKTYQAKLLTSAKYVTTSFVGMSIASQSKGLKWL